LGVTSEGSGKVVHSFVGETEWHQLLVPGPLHFAPMGW